MSLHTRLAARLNSTVTLKTRTGYNVVGDPTYAAGVTHPARVEHRHQMVVGPTGEDVLARGRVILGPSSSGGPTFSTGPTEDELTLADGTRPPILAVEQSTGPNIGNKVVIFFG